MYTMIIYYYFLSLSAFFDSLGSDDIQAKIEKDSKDLNEKIQHDQKEIKDKIGKDQEKMKKEADKNKPKTDEVSKAVIGEFMSKIQEALDGFLKQEGVNQKKVHQNDENVKQNNKDLDLSVKYEVDGLDKPVMEKFADHFEKDIKGPMQDEFRNRMDSGLKEKKAMEDDKEGTCDISLDISDKLIITVNYQSKFMNAGKKVTKTSSSYTSS